MRNNYYVVIEQTTDDIKAVFLSTSSEKAKSVYECLEKDAEVSAKKTKDGDRPYYYLNRICLGVMFEKISEVYEKYKNEVLKNGKENS